MMSHINTVIPHVQQPNQQASLWRYMGLAAFIAMLSRRSLRLSSVQLFEDKYEGWPPIAAIRGMKGFLERHIPAEAPRLLDTYENFRRGIFVSCWHQNDVESEAMWRIYSLLQEGIAIRTTVERLHHSLGTDRWPGECYAGLVNYGDLAADGAIWLPIFPFIKRLSFRHENEYRLALIKRGPMVRKPSFAQYAWRKWSKKSSCLPK